MTDIGTAITVAIWLIEAAWFGALYVYTSRLRSDDHE